MEIGVLDNSFSGRLYSVSDTKRVQVDLPNRRKLNNNVNYRITFIMSYFVSQSTEQAL